MRNVRPLGASDQNRRAGNGRKRLSGRVSSLSALAPEVIEVGIELEQEAGYLPGQYFQVQFRGFPARPFCATVPLDRFGQHDCIHLHVRRIRDGRVSSALMQGISVGHHVTLKGPLGSAYLRPRMSGRLVLISGSTGFAPIWAIADAAMREDYERELVLVVSARSIESLYMIPALWRLAGCPNATIIPVTDASQSVSSIIRTGVATDFVPELRRDDTIYAAGPPAMIRAVESMAEMAGVTCYTEAFAPTLSGGSLVSRAIGWLARNKTFSRPILNRQRSNTALEPRSIRPPVRPMRSRPAEMPADAPG